MLPSTKFAEDDVLVFFILRQKMLKQCNFMFTPNPNFRAE